MSVRDPRRRDVSQWSAPAEAQTDPDAPSEADAAEYGAAALRPRQSPLPNYEQMDPSADDRQHRPASPGNTPSPALNDRERRRSRHQTDGPSKLAGGSTADRNPQEAEF